MFTEFPLPQKQTPFGLVSDPKIPLSVRTLAGYSTYRFLIDTGADFSLAPRRLAQQLGLEWKTLPETRVMGIEQAGVMARLGLMPIRLQSIELKVRTLFVDTRKPLFILGRADFLDRFVLTIDQHQRKIILTKIM
ncbi:MAG: aspartyl protease family protein [Ignavibacteriae bacterium]|nr:aspartyl protease family protein [Ignavibacteriota bacterium]